ncbi:MAG: GNAT family N-acetyltransferase [Candidatus Nealsonbacteria bacterium]|nr:GNAT family N-acetyltransferase [Candidatus Nealsonbacteria bacterium]
MTIHIRKAVPGDIPGIRNVQKVTWLDTYTNKETDITPEDIKSVFKDDDKPERKKKIEEIKKRYKEKGKQTWVAEENGKIVGFCEAINEKNNRCISAIYILPQCHGKGIGGRLIAKAFDWLGEDKPISVTPVEYNINAINFYKRYGFVDTGEKIPRKNTIKLPTGKILPEIKLIRPAQS